MLSAYIMHNRKTEDEDLWKWDRSMLPAGKLPLRFLFLTGLVMGVFAVYFGKGTWFGTAGMLDEDTLYRMKYMTVDSSGLFVYVLCKRCRNSLVLIIMATTYLGLIFCGGITVKYGFSVGLFLAAAIYRYGIKGILLGIVSIFPQYLCYVPAMVLLLRWCEDLHRSIYFHHNITGQGKKSLHGRVGRSALYFLVLLFGCVLECFVNPVLLQGFLKFF